MSDSTLVIFAKCPRAGAVNTRLCPPLTLEEAARLQRVCVQSVCERAFRGWPVKPWLAYTPDDGASEMRQVAGPYVPLVAQGAGDLGDRIFRVASGFLDQGASQVLVVGSDSPTMPDDRIEKAQKALKKADVVIGPCDDGGFYLIGMRKVAEGMFGDVEWGSENACDQTMDGVSGAGLKCVTIEPWYDVDRFDDLARAAADLKASNRLDAFVLLRTMESIVRDAKERAAS